MPLCFWHLLISIHAPRVGGDVETETELKAKILISIHAPRVGGDLGSKTS